MTAFHLHVSASACVSRPCALCSSVYNQYGESRPHMFGDSEGVFQREKSLMGEMMGW